MSDTSNYSHQVKSGSLGTETVQKGSTSPNIPFFDPPIPNINHLHTLLTPERLATDSFAKLLPKCVKLSDPALGLVVILGVAVAKCIDRWPLNFNPAGYAIASPAMVYMGHSYNVNVIKGQFSHHKSKSLYILCGSDGYDTTRTQLITINRLAPMNAQTGKGGALDTLRVSLTRLT